MEIRIATDQDISALKALSYQLYDEHYQKDPQGFKPPELMVQMNPIQTYLDEFTCLLLVAEDKDEMIGFVSASFEPVKNAIYANHLVVGSIDDLYLKPKYRGCGIGQRLLKAMEHELKNNHVDEVLIEVFDFNRAAHKVYVKSGFKPHIQCLKKSI